MGENSYVMPAEPLSPELALVDPELGARARSMLPESVPAAETAARDRWVTRAQRCLGSSAGHSDGAVSRLGTDDRGALAGRPRDPRSAAPRSRTRRTSHASSHRPRTRPSASPPRLHPTRALATWAALSGPRRQRALATIGRPGAIAQLGERLDRTQEVGSSSLPSSIEKPAGNGGFLRFLGSALVW